MPENFKENEFNCLGEKAKNIYISNMYQQYHHQTNMSISRVTKDWSENRKQTEYYMKFIDSFRFMSTSFSSLTDNLLEIHGGKCDIL